MWGTWGLAMMDISPDETAPAAPNTGPRRVDSRRAPGDDDRRRAEHWVGRLWRDPVPFGLAREARRCLAGIGILTVYALIGWFGAATERLDPAILRLALRFGAAVGGMFAISMLCEYIVPHDHEQNVLLAYATFGLFFFSLLAAGAVGPCPRDGSGSACSRASGPP